MRMARFCAPERLAHLVQSFSVVETEAEATRLLVPVPGIAVAVRYAGAARLHAQGTWRALPDVAVSGLQDRARTIRTAAGGGLVVAQLHPAAAAAFLGTAPAALAGRTLALQGVLPVALTAALADAIAARSDDAGRIAAFETFLLAHSRADRIDPLLHAAVGSITRSGGVLRIAELAAQLALSEDALEKRFTRVFGMGPKRLARLVRLRSTLRAYRPGAQLTQLAHAGGFFDQSHFNREVRRVTGVAPSQLLRAGVHC
ncbi:helix-turn-helix transcriptional regulator [Ramlibacter sp.]|uniref:helix-turn-helix transcriptional regulator n=1 Tax=Ramlibacter sp. TaxID=1917967 RepID=UPI001827F94B|nr:helix-turn-helix transcriptional regulator [Ramlibacter sp.]MBA2672115.1 helix-turn-helix transcriptional regulator [Ramlibacter sp.]